MSPKILVSRRWCAVAASFLLVGLLVWPTATGAQAGSTTFSGQASVVKASVLGSTIVVSDTGPLPPSGGAQEASLLTVSVPNLLTAGVAHATTIGQADRSRSEASLADLNLNVAGNSISASFIMARAIAVCCSVGPSVTGSSLLAGLVINGQAIVVSEAPNQTIPLPAGAGKVVINEQTSQGAGDITVNALHVVVNGVADVIVSSAHADITCAGPPPCGGANDFVTGGGWITGTPSGARANFGVADGTKNGMLWGHLTYIDHGPNGPKVKGTGVTAYVATSTLTRHIEGTAEINGQGGFTYNVDVTDNGEPGTNDMFAISLSNGYSASGTLRGGNIQLHVPKPCQ